MSCSSKDKIFGVQYLGHSRAIMPQRITLISLMHFIINLSFTFSNLILLPWHYSKRIKFKLAIYYIWSGTKLIFVWLIFQFICYIHTHTHTHTFLWVFKFPFCLRMPLVLLLSLEEIMTFFIPVLLVWVLYVRKSRRDKGKILVR